MEPGVILMGHLPFNLAAMKELEVRGTWHYINGTFVSQFCI
jgi:hypothetical protein